VAEDGLDALFENIKQIRNLLNGKTPDGNKATFGPRFTSTRYAIVLFTSTLMSVLKEDILDSQDEGCVEFNLYGLKQVAETMRLEFDRTRTAKRMYEELIRKGDIAIKRDESHEYLCITEKGKERCLKKIQELKIIESQFEQLPPLQGAYKEGKKPLSKGYNKDPIYLQSKRKVDELIESVSDTEAIPDSNSKALIIGISKYDRLQRLDFCSNDGNDMYETLKSLGYNITDNNRLVGYISWNEMRDTIYDFFTDSDIKPEDLLMFYYSGHGVPDEDGDVYISTSELNPDMPNRRGFGFGELTKLMQKCISTKIVCILDCCYSGSAKISKGHEDDAVKLGIAALDKESRSLGNGEGRCILAASQALQEAYGLEEESHSIFTHYLLQGLKGGAKEAIDTNGNVTVDSLSKFVYNTIMSLPSDKRPKQKPIKKVEASGDIILAHYNSDEMTDVEEDEGKSQSSLSKSKESYLPAEIHDIENIRDQIKDCYEKSKQKRKQFSILECAKELKIPYTTVREIVSKFK
jgi:hypothetical protein